MRKSLQRYAAVLLAIFVLVHAPWKLTFMMGEAMLMSPGPIKMSHSNAHYWEALLLEARLIGMGWTVMYQHDLAFDGEKAFGITNPEDHTIKIEQRLSWNERLTVLAHEGGHVLEPVWAGRAQRECFAESVAGLVGHDGLREHARYLARYKVDCLVIYFTEWQAIYHAAQVLEDN